MNPIADLKADALRTLFIYIVPGAIAVLPWLCFFVHEVNGILGYADEHQPLAAVVLLLLCLSIGKLTDGLGTLWEVNVNDARLTRKSEFPNFQSDWQRYIRTAFIHEPVAVGYIENLTQTLKFELNVGAGFGLFAAGQIPLARILENYSACHGALVVLGALAIAAFAFWSSYGTSYVLASVRKWLGEGIVLQGADAGS